MPSVSDESPSAADLTSSELAAGDCSPEALAVQGAAPTLRGSTSEPFHSSSNDDDGKPIGSQLVPAEIVNMDEGDQKEAVISILEDWAAWERGLEEEAEKMERATTHEPLVEVVAAEPAASLNIDNTNSLPHTKGSDNSPTNRVVAEFINDPAPTVTFEQTPKRTANSSASYSAAGSNNQLLYASRRERRRAERHDPAARARRQALKVWAADQTRRRSSASEISVSESLRQQGAGSLKEWAAMNSTSSWRSSAEATVDHNRKGAGGSSEIERFRRKKPPAHVFAPRQISVQRNSRNIVDLRLESRRSPCLSVAEQPKQQAAGGKAGQRPTNPHPWRANMKPPEERGERSAFGIAREGDAPTAPSTPRSPAAAALSPSSSFSSMFAGRGSAWARSPSRETAGGILVKHCFFYGSSGRATSPKAVAATTSPSFESKWMRQFREEVSSNPNWWLGPDRFALGRATTSNRGNARGGGAWSSGRRARRSTQALTTRGKGSRTDRTTDLWQEVRSLLAAGRYGGATYPSGSDPDREDDGDGLSRAPGRVDLLSFGDRLRCTPLSQGAWLVGRAAAAATAEQRPTGASSIPEEGGLPIAATDVVGVAADGVGVEGEETGKKEAGADEAGSGQVPSSEAPPVKKDRGGQSDGSVKASDVEKRRSNPQDLQSIHAATLAKLRGEIDPFTREELVLRAAEEARGALARERARSTSPRRASVGVFRPSSQRIKRGAVPDSIDYDKVEATLSLIELATRAAGPDAGKQMLQALEGLDKMHQRVSEEKHTAEKEQREDGLDGETGSIGPQGAPPIALAEQRSERSGSRALAGVSSVTAGDDTAVTANGENFPDAAVQDEAGSTLSREPSRKFSLAVSSSSEESATSGSDTSSVGIMQTIGNWLWSTPSPTRSRSNSRSSDLEAAAENQSGLGGSGCNEFPSAPEGSDAREPLETNDASDQAASDDEEHGDQDAPAPRRASKSGSSEQDCGSAEKPSGLPDPAAEGFDAKGSTTPDGTPTELRDNGCQAETRASDVATKTTVGMEESASNGQAAAGGHAPDWSLRVRARRSSEADKPSGLPQLAKETARGDEESILDAADLRREGTRGCGEQGHPSSSEAPASVDPDGGKEQGDSEASRSLGLNETATAAAGEEVAAAPADVDAAASNDDQETINTGRSSGVSYGSTVEADRAAPPPHAPTSSSRQAELEAKQDGDVADEYLVNAATETPEKYAVRVLAAEPCPEGKAEDPGGPAAGAANGDAAAAAEENKDEGLGASSSPASPLTQRDSWFSVGTRPRRGDNTNEKQASASEETPAADAERRNASGRQGKVSTQATAGAVGAGIDSPADRKGGTKQDTGAPGARRVPPSVCAQFVWSRPGQVCSPKRLRPPGPSGKDNKAPRLPRAPGIVRRSPLIDAFHPEVARQREFQLQLRQARQLGAPPGPTKPEDEDFQDAAEFLPEAAAENSEVDKTANLATTGAAPSAATSGFKGAGARRRHAATATGTVAATALVPTTTTGGVRARHPRRPGWSETAPLPVPPSPASKPSRPLLFPTASEAAAGASGDEPACRSFADGADAAARAGRLSALQWECVETWMVRAERSLGPKAWACLGSSDGLHRTRNRIRQSLVSGGDGHQASATRWDGSPPTDDAGSPHLGLTVDSEDAVPPCGGRRAKGRQDGGAKPRAHRGARKRGALNGERAGAKDVAREEGRKDEEPAAGGGCDWDQVLSERAALAIHAVMWTIATERERSTYCAAFAPEGDTAVSRDGGETIIPVANAIAQQQPAWGTYNDRPRGGGGGAVTRDPNPAATTAALDLRVSLSAARRFVKSSRLIDGNVVLDADVDLAFKRREGVGRLAGRDRHCSLTTGTTRSRSPVRRGAKIKVDDPFLDPRAVMPPTQKLCEAVGCSDPAQYGDVHPLATARLCRKHRRHGMVDVGSRRCERSGCGRIAVGASTNACTAGGALCTLHARAGRVDAEGFADVLLELSKARHTRGRRSAASAATAASSEEQASSTFNSDGGLAETLIAAAVRNVLLAVTDQPLVPGLPAMGRQLSSSAAAQGSAYFAPGDNAAVEPGNGASRHHLTVTPASTFTSTGSFRRGPVAGRRPATPGDTVSTAATASEQHRRRGSRSGVSTGKRCNPGIPETGTGSGVLETVGRVYRRSAAVASAVLGASPAPAESGFERGRGDLRSHWQGTRWQSGLLRRENGFREGEGKGACGEQGVGRMDDASASAGDGEVLDARAPRRRKSRLRQDFYGDGGSGGGGGDLHDDQKRHTEEPLKSHGIHDTTQSRGATVGVKSSRDGTRRKGVAEVLAENATSLQAMFRKFSRPSADCMRGATMTLPDVLRLCDAFELRPGLVSTREIVDAYKEVAYPGVVGLTDEDLGFFGSKQKHSNPNLSISKSVSGRPSDPEKPPPQAISSSANTFNEGKGDRESLAPEGATLGSPELQRDAASRGMTLEDLARATDVGELAGNQETYQNESDRERTERGARTWTRTEQEEGGKTQALSDEDDMRGDSGGTRGIGQKENSARWAWSRRGTEECSLYFRSDSGSESRRMPSPSRRNSTASNSDTGGKRKRTVYLGRTQSFPLRRVESSLAVNARGFGLSGVLVSADAKGGSSRQRGSSNLASSSSRRILPSRRASVESSGRGEGPTTSGETFGLTEPQFFGWLSEVAMECKALTTKKTFGHSLTRSLSERGNPGRSFRGKAKPGQPIRGGIDKMESGGDDAASARRNAARAVVLLQWMEVSRGMKNNKTGDIPPFRLSSCVVNGKP